MEAGGPKSHLVGRLREALAEDARTNALDLQITVAGGKVFIMGTVASAELRAAAEEVVRELVPPGLAVVNDLQVAELIESTASEWVP